MERRTSTRLAYEGYAYPFRNGRLQNGSDISALQGSVNGEYLWFNTGIYPDDVLDASEHPRQYEMTVTGRKRVKPGTPRTTLGTKLELNGQTIAIFRYEDEFYAVSNRCPHQGGQLHLGDIEEMNDMLCISCPRHHWPFSLEDGSCQVNDSLQLDHFPVQERQHDDDARYLYIGFPSLGQALFSSDDF